MAGANRNRASVGLGIGLFIVGVGLVLLLDQLGIVSAGYLFRFFWSAIFIFFGLETVVSCRGRGGRGLIGVLLLAFGLLLLAGALGFLRVGIYTLWPLLLIIWGVWVMARAFGLTGDRGLSGKIRDAIHDSIHEKIHDSVHDSIHENFQGTPGEKPPRDWADSVKRGIQDTVNNWTGRESTDPEFDYLAIFGAIKQRVTVKNFRGGRLMALFGGFEVDLTRADIEGQTAVIDASALMGGGEIRVPYNWVVEIRGLALLGGYTDETHQEVQDAATAKHLIVKGIAALGGVVIKN
jgi:Cell wall-active antibiotics response 4TMS YvqF